jgi:hypothetical protein
MVVFATAIVGMAQLGELLQVPVPSLDYKIAPSYSCTVAQLLSCTPTCSLPMTISYTEARPPTCLVCGGQFSRLRSGWTNLYKRTAASPSSAGQETVQL